MHEFNQRQHRPPPFAFSHLLLETSGLDRDAPRVELTVPYPMIHQDSRAYVPSNYSPHRFSHKT
jgi:hypothetical protein